MASDSPGKAWIALNSPLWSLGFALFIVIVAAASGSSSYEPYQPYVPPSPAPFTPSFDNPWESAGKPTEPEPPFKISDTDLEEDLIPYADPLMRFTVLHPSSVVLAPSVMTNVMASGLDPKSGIYMEVSGSSAFGLVAAEALVTQFEPIIISRRAGYQRVSTRIAPLGGDNIRAVEIVATYASVQRGGAVTKCIMRFGGWGTNGYWIILEAPLQSFDTYGRLFEAIFDSLQTS